MRIAIRIACIAFFLLLCMSCQARPVEMLSAMQEEAVCKSIIYLRENGFLEHHADAKEVDLQLWDKMKYLNEGVMDWDGLIKDRQDRYTNKLYGLTKDRSDYLVYYVEDEGFSCVRRLIVSFTTVGVTPRPCI